MWRGDSFFLASVDACRILGRRGVLLSRHGDHIPANLPPNIIHVDYAPFSELLPRIAAIVHHGGIGTTSQGLKAGIPQLVMAMSHDQPDNVNRLRRLGVGEAIAPEAYHGPSIAKVLTKLLNSAEVDANCRSVASRFTNGDPFSRTCELIEETAPVCA
jgi:UDP:flavonoid glycosyltransferase YjiC (YdhE family)